MTDVEAAKSGFDNLVNRISQKNERKLFFAWLREEYLPALECPKEYDEKIESRVHLQRIAGELRDLVPLEAVLETEKIIPPTVGEDAGLDTTNTVHLDAFLYEADDEERFVNEGRIPKSRCRDCGSKNIEDFVTLSHSCSHTRLELIFRGMCPSLKEKTVVDLGSRIGAVLYGAFYHSEASRIVGVELNAQFCDIANRIVKKHLLNKRIEIVNDDVLNVPNVIKSANVLVMNNVFEWFNSLQDQIKLWRYLKDVVSPGTLLVTVPSLENSLEHLQTGISLEEWVEEEPWADPDIPVEEADEGEVFFYRVR